MSLISTGSRYLRQLGIYNPDEHQHDAVTFIGVGGIGSFAAFGAAKLGVPNIMLIDPDVVEAHNQPNQFYGEGDIGESKAESLASYMYCDTGLEIDYEHIAVDADSNIRPGVVVSGLDSMSARAEVWEAIKLNPAVPLYIDARLGGSVIVIYAVNPTDYEDVQAYEKTLHSDEEGEDTACTERGIIDVGLQVGSLITRMLRHHFTGKPVDRITVFNQETLIITKGEWVK